MPLDLLAQSGNTKATQGDVVLWVAVLIVTAFLGGLVIMWVRKKLLAKERPSDAGTMMEQLRDMLARGEITQHEFDATKRAMVKRLKDRGTGPVASQPPAEPPVVRKSLPRPSRSEDTPPSA